MALISEIHYYRETKQGLLQMKRTVLIVAAVIIAIVGFFVATKPKNPAQNNSGVQPTSHIEGKGSAGVTLIEYGDYQCPYCQEYYPIVKQVQTQFADQIFLQFRNFPLESLHKNARAGARAAEAANLQGKFWEMHDALFENNDPKGATGWVASSNPTTYFNQFAQSIGINVEQFKADFASSKVNDLINADLAAGTALKITGTPTFFLDGKKLDPSPNGVDAFAKVITAEIAAKTKK